MVEHVAHSFTPSQLILGTMAHLPTKCHLPCAMPHPMLSARYYLERLQATLAANQHVAQHYVLTPATLTPSPHKPGECGLLAMNQNDQPHKMSRKWKRPYDVVRIPHQAQVKFIITLSTVVIVNNEHRNISCV